MQHDKSLKTTVCRYQTSAHTHSLDCSMLEYGMAAIVMT